MSLRIGLVGLDSSHSEDFLRHLNIERRHAGLQVTAVQGGDNARLAELLTLDPSIIAFPTLDELIDNADAVIVGHRDGALHRDAAVACLTRGLPVFVDKPLANSRADAEAIASAAQRSGAQVLSGSALRWQGETLRIKQLLSGVGGSIQLHVWGTWYPDSEYGAIFYAIHTIELAQELLGPKFGDVTFTGTDEPTVSYRSGDNEVTLSFHPLGSSGHSDFGVEAVSNAIHLREPIPLGDDYMLPIVDHFAAMLRNGTSPMSPEDLIAPLALMESIDALRGAFS